MSDSIIALQVVMMPRDANPLPCALTLPDGRQYPLYNTVFGGVLLSYIDQAGAIGARQHIIRAGGPPPYLVTVAMNRVEFKKPVLVGDVVRFLVRLVRIGRTSVTVHVQVEADRFDKLHQVTEAEVVFVNIDPNSPDRHPVPLLAGGGEKPAS